MVQLLFSLSMAILGALFFLANTLKELRDKSDAESREESTTAKKFDFNTAVFWGDFWYRLGEAVLFTIVTFLYFRYGGISTATLPIVALFLGMFIRTGEQIVFGLSKRLLLGAQALIPFTDESKPTPPPKPPTNG